MNMKLQVEDNKDNMVLLSQFYPPSALTPTGIVPQQREPSKPKRRQRKRSNNNRDGGFSAFKKRKLTAQQAELLEVYFGYEQKLESDRKDRLAVELGLDPRQVAVWFQNRRARDKTKKIEESYASLKAAHENVVVEKTRLQAEVEKLKEKLSVADKEVKRMTEAIEGISLNKPSPTSVPVNMDTMDSPFALDPLTGWFDYDDLFYLVQQNYLSAS